MPTIKAEGPAKNKNFNETLDTDTCAGICIQKFLLFFLCLITGIIFLCVNSGCKTTANNDAAGKIYSVTDDYGYVLHFDKKPERVFGTTTSIEEILLYLLPHQKIAAISNPTADEDTSLVLEKALQIKNRVPQNASIETIIALRPDLVFMQMRDNHAAADTLSEMGIKVYRMQVATNMNMIRKRIMDIGHALGEPTKSEKLLQDFDSKIRHVKNMVNAIPVEKRRTIIGFSSLGAFGSSTGLFHQICAESGIINGGDLAGILYSERISDEQIVRINPDYFVVLDEGRENNYGKNIEKRILEDKALVNTTAYRERKIIFFKGRYAKTNTQFFADAVTDLAKKIYPEYVK